MKKGMCLFLSILLLLSALSGCKEQAPASSTGSQNSAETSISPSPEVTSASSEEERLSPKERKQKEKMAAFASPTPAPTPELENISQREKDWREDLSFFKKQYTKHHPAPFYYVTEEELDRQLEELAQKADQLSDTDLYFEFATLVAGLRDTHTHVYPIEDLYTHIFPVGRRWIDGKLYLIGYWEKFDQFQPWLLHEIVSVNGVDVKYLLKKADGVVDPVNQWRSRLGFIEDYVNPAFFDWAGCDYRDGYTFEFLDDDQKVVSVEMPLVTQDADVLGEKGIYPEGWEQITYYNQKEGATLFETERGSCVILDFGRSMGEGKEHYREIMESASALLTEHPDAKLVVDLRGNGGGLWESLHAIEANIPLLTQSRTPQTYVLTDGFTQSAAVHLLNSFKQEMDAVQVGEPTGQFFLAFSSGGGGIIETTPNFQISFSVANSNIYMTGKDPDAFYDEDGKLYEWENTVLPDVYAPLLIEDVRAGKDSAIEWVLAQ